MGGGRPRPVVWHGMFMAMSAAFLGFSGLADLMPKTVIAWIMLVVAVVGAGWTVYVQGEVTPLSDPRDNEGRKLEPVGVDVKDPGDDGSPEAFPGALRAFDGEVRTHRPVPYPPPTRRPGSTPASRPEAGDPDRDWP